MSSKLSVIDELRTVETILHQFMVCYYKIKDSRERLEKGDGV